MVKIYIYIYIFINRRLRRLSLVLLQIPLSVGPCAKRSSIVRNDHGRTQRCEFSVLDQKHPFWANLSQKIKIVNLSWNSNMRNSMVMFTFSVFDLVPRLIRIWTFSGYADFFCFRPKIPFLDKFVPKTKIVSLSWSLVPRLIRICILQWWCSLFLF